MCNYAGTKANYFRFFFAHTFPSCWIACQFRWQVATFFYNLNAFARFDVADVDLKQIWHLKYADFLVPRAATFRWLSQIEFLDFRQYVKCHIVSQEVL